MLSTERCWSDEQYEMFSRDVSIKVFITEIIPKDFDMHGYCGRSYFEFEQRVIAYLQSVGWKMITRFMTSDGDSFGPLVRLAKARNPLGQIVEISHG